MSAIKKKSELVSSTTVGLILFAIVFVLFIIGGCQAYNKLVVGDEPTTSINSLERLRIYADKDMQENSPVAQDIAPLQLEKGLLIECYDKEHSNRPSACKSQSCLCLCKKGGCKPPVKCELLDDDRRLIDCSISPNKPDTPFQVVVSYEQDGDEVIVQIEDSVNSDCEKPMGKEGELRDDKLCIKKDDQYIWQLCDTEGLFHTIGGVHYCCSQGNWETVERPGDCLGEVCKKISRCNDYTYAAIEYLHGVGRDYGLWEELCREDSCDLRKDCVVKERTTPRNHPLLQKIPMELDTLCMEQANDCPEAAKMPAGVSGEYFLYGSRCWKCLDDGLICPGSNNKRKPVWCDITFNHKEMDYCQNNLKECPAGYYLIDSTPSLHNGGKGCCTKQDACFYTSPSQNTCISPGKDAADNWICKDAILYPCNNEQDKADHPFLELGEDEKYCCQESGAEYKWRQVADTVECGCASMAWDTCSLEQCKRCFERVPYTSIYEAACVDKGRDCRGAEYEEIMANYANCPLNEALYRSGDATLCLCGGSTHPPRLYARSTANLPEPVWCCGSAAESYYSNYPCP